MVRLTGTFSHFHPIKAFVVGDFMLDTYTTGKVERISPEAPVSILKVEKEESRPGGAGNVVLNLMTLGASVVACGRVGSDFQGATLCTCLEEKGADTRGVYEQKGYKTPVKNRLIADSQQVLRVDQEKIDPLPKAIEKEIIDSLDSYLEGVKVVAVSDYSKGFLSKNLIRKIIQSAKKKNIPVIIDPKGSDFSKYRGATIIKPNLHEAYLAAKLSLEHSLDKVAEVLLRQTEADTLLITRSSEGISYFDQKGSRKDFPVRSKEVKDVTGAGDTVLAMISASLGNDLDITHASQLANIAAGMAIERLGCAHITLSELARRLLEEDIDNKIFDESHLYALKQVLQGKRFSVLGLDSKNGMTTAIFRTIRSLAAHKGDELILYIHDSDPDEEFISLLSSLNEVDFIILKKESLEHLCEEIHPHKVFVMENDKAVALDHARALLSTLVQQKTAAS